MTNSNLSAYWDEKAHRYITHRAGGETVSSTDLAKVLLAQEYLRHVKDSVGV